MALTSLVHSHDKQSITETCLNVVYQDSHSCMPLLSQQHVYVVRVVVHRLYHAHSFQLLLAFERVLPSRHITLHMQQADNNPSVSYSDT